MSDVILTLSLVLICKIYSLSRDDMLGVSAVPLFVFAATYMASADSAGIIPSALLVGFFFLPRAMRIDPVIGRHSGASRSHGGAMAALKAATPVVLLAGALVILMASILLAEQRLVRSPDTARPSGTPLPSSSFPSVRLDALLACALLALLVALVVGLIHMNRSAPSRVSAVTRLLERLGELSGVSVDPADTIGDVMAKIQAGTGIDTVGVRQRLEQNEYGRASRVGPPCQIAEVVELAKELARRAGTS